ncbi:S8 family serine peptidase [Paenibacillus albicereus]|uniref:S8 family serine peptidase n=1 Tax=Paenibacillus albicereus TaxID=2726185 RepID=A0A6H2H2F2_9BACL|nr:S8 family serine peptidase [Paenibacillus albicereus]QJC53815.1 S8 family serine peptidase [Paenibacillus albicereus]
MKRRLILAASHRRKRLAAAAAAVFLASVLVAGPAHPNEPVRVLDARSAPEPASRLTVAAAAQAGGAAQKEQQAYLRQIGALEALADRKKSSGMTVAIVDTGVDLQHPALKGRLLPGANLLQPGKPPQDDNGHGTSVAGVVAALLPQAKLLPVKALDENGYAEERGLGEAIRKALDKGARIIVLSVGLYHSSAYMADIVGQAERKGVLLVAAAGNDSLRFGSKTTVKYPAAYPTVLAVGGVAADGSPERRSSKGSEIDVAGSWRVFTAQLGGGYRFEEGTSMAAPQAAAAAALLWSKYPKLKPYEIRSYLRQTTKDTPPAGFDPATGYGLLRMEQALSSRYKADPHEPNDGRGQAASLPLGKQLSAVLAGGADRDWFVLDCPHDGSVKLRLQQLLSPGQAPAKLGLLLEQAEGSVEKKLEASNNVVVWRVKKGANRLRLQLQGAGAPKAAPYLLSSVFSMRPDDGEPNGRAEEATALADRSQSLKAGFHETDDLDWYKIQVKKAGKLRLQVEPGTMRMDAAFAYRRAGSPETAVDEAGEGAAEASASIQVTPGTYYVRVWDAAEPPYAPPEGFYTLTVERG